MYLPPDRDTAIAAIQAVPLPVIAIKVLAAGRSEPFEAFRFALENIKPIDAMAVGMYTRGHPDQIRENAETVASLIEKHRWEDQNLGRLPTNVVKEIDGTHLRA